MQIVWNIDGAHLHDKESVDEMFIQVLNESNDD